MPVHLAKYYTPNMEVWEAGIYSNQYYSVCGFGMCPLFPDPDIHHSPQTFSEADP